MNKVLLALLALIFVALAATGGLIFFSRHHARVPIEQTYGPTPTLAEPSPEWMPNVNVAEAAPWPDGAKPTASPGFAVNEFAGGLDHPRWLHVLPNGDVLVAESNAPPKPEEGFSVRGFFMDLFQGEAGADTPSAN